MYSTWTPKSKLFATQERVSTSLAAVAARRKHMEDNLDIETNEFDEQEDDDDDDEFPSLLEAKRQNALFKQREMERLQHELNDINSRLRVERDHYQQWARSPIRRSYNSVLYRGIQQLRARVGKEESEKSNDKKVSFSHSIYPKEEVDKLKEHTNSQTQTVSQYPYHPQTVSQSQSCTLRRQRTADSGFSRYSSYSRSPLKVPNAVVHVLSERLQDQDASQNQERKLGSSRSTDLAQGKSRFGVIRHRERFPLSVNTPKCFDDHPLVVNQSLRSSDSSRQKSKLDLKELDSRLQKPEYRLKSLDSKHQSHERDDVIHLQTQRSGSYFGSFAPRKLLATIRIAELYDFSKHGPAELRYLERQLTDPNMMMRGSKVIKWVPNLQRMKEKN